MRGFFSSMVNARQAIGMPPDIQSLVAWRGNSKDRAKHIFRVDGANEYIVSYTDGYTASMVTASAQPLWTPTGWYFDGSKQLVTDNIPDVVFAVVVANSTRNFVGYDCFISSYQAGVPYASIMGQVDTTLFQQVGSLNYTQSDMRVNNIASTEFAPNSTFKVISAKFGAKNFNIYDIGLNDGGNGSLQGYIKDIILFHTEPNPTQKAVLQAYLEFYHNI